MSNDDRPQIAGRWWRGPNAGQAGILSDVRAGLVHGVLSNGARVLGSPHDFQAQSGETGDSLLGMLLPRPTASSFFAGAVREALAAVRSTAIFGRQDTRAWETPSLYIVDDGEGNAASAQLLAGAVVGAMCSHDPTRHFEILDELVPAGQREALASLLRLPFLQSTTSLVTAIFWTEDGRLSSPEPWFKTYQFGGEIFRRELLGEAAWRREAAEQHDLDAATACAIVDISKRAAPLKPVKLTENDVTRLLPHGAAHREEASHQLFGGGMFTIESKTGPVTF